MARDELRAAVALAGEATAAIERATMMLEAILSRPAQGDLASATLPPECPLRAAHGSRQLSKIERDPEVEAFIRARMDRLTFKALVAEVAAAFPPERHVSLSGVHRWWHRHVAPTRRSSP